MIQLVSRGVLLIQDWVFPVLLGPDSFRDCMYRFLLQVETQLVKHLVSYRSRELSWPSEVTVKMIRVLETASTKGSAVCHRCRMNRGRHSTNRWTVRGRLSPLITPEDLTLEETARAPVRSCYHLQREGLAYPLLTLCLWQHLLAFIWVLIMYQEDKKGIFARNVSVDCQGSSFSSLAMDSALFSPSESDFGSLPRSGYSYWVQDGEGWMEKVSGLYSIPKVTMSHLSFFFFFWNCSIHFSWIHPLMGSQRRDYNLFAKAAHF